MPINTFFDAILLPHRQTDKHTRFREFSKDFRAAYNIAYNIFMSSVVCMQPATKLCRLNDSCCRYVHAQT